MAGAAGSTAVDVDAASRAVEPGMQVAGSTAGAAVAVDAA
eukprot:COSAG02_NODE_58297_length_278_cov_0.418994_1_plen_39_part_10